MYLEIITTITTRIDVDTLESSHSTDVEGEEGIPENVLRACAIAGCLSTVRALKGEE